jgi:hypothetical protein
MALITSMPFFPSFSVVFRLTFEIITEFGLVPDCGHCTKVQERFHFVVRKIGDAAAPFKLLPD